MQQDRAEEVALLALGWLAANDELLPVFQGASGAGLEDMRRGAGDPTFLGAVLDFLLMDDAWVTGCCQALEMPCDGLMAARQALPGGALPNWT